MTGNPYYNPQMNPHADMQWYNEMQQAGQGVQGMTGAAASIGGPKAAAATYGIGAVLESFGDIAALRGGRDDLRQSLQDGPDDLQGIQTSMDQRDMFGNLNYNVDHAGFESGLQSQQDWIGQQEQSAKGLYDNTKIGINDFIAKTWRTKLAARRDIRKEFGDEREEGSLRKPLKYFQPRGELGTENLKSRLGEQVKDNERKMRTSLSTSQDNFNQRNASNANVQQQRMAYTQQLRNRFQDMGTY